MQQEFQSDQLNSRVVITAFPHKKQVRGTAMWWDDCHVYSVNMVIDKGNSGDSVDFTRLRALWTYGDDNGKRDLFTEKYMLDEPVLSYLAACFKQVVAEFKQK